MNRTPILTLLAASLLLLASCKNNKAGLPIPKDAAVVLHINTSSLASKLSWDDIKKMAWFQETYQDTKDSLGKKLLDNPAASGIDLHADLAFFLERRRNGGYGIFEGNLKDANAFEAFLKEVCKTGKLAKDGDWNMMIASGASLFAWNQNKFAFIIDAPMGSMSPMNKGMGRTTEFGIDSLKAFVKETMALSGDKSLSDDDRFASMLKEPGDMHLWMNQNSLYSDALGIFSMMKIGDLLKGNVTASAINFDDGKITMKAKQYYGKEMQEVVKKWNSKNIDASVLNRIPSNNVIGVMAANIDPQSLKDFIVSMGFDGLLNGLLASQNLSLDDIFSATKGEFVVAVSDLSMKPTTVSIPREGDNADYTYTSNKPDFSVLFATNVNKKESFDKLLNGLNEKTSQLPVTYKLNDSWFAVSNKPEAVDKFLSSSSGKQPFADKISGHPFGFYLNMQQLLKTNFVEKGPGREMLDASAATWQDVVATAQSSNDGTATSEIVVNMVDQKTNSLKQLNQFIEKMYEAQKKAKVAYEDEDRKEVDSKKLPNAIPPPPPVTNPQ